MNHLCKYNVISNEGKVLGVVSAPSGDIANSTAQQKFPTESRLHVVMHPDELPYLTRVYAAVSGKQLTTFTPDTTL